MHELKAKSIRICKPQRLFRSKKLFGVELLWPSCSAAKSSSLCRNRSSGQSSKHATFRELCLPILIGDPIHNLSVPVDRAKDQALKN